MPEAHLELVRGFLDEATADRLFADLHAHSGWRQETAVMFGKEVRAPRLTAWCGDPGAAYVYSGLRHEPEAWTPPLADLRDRIADWGGVRFNSVLLNLYRDGADGVGWHSDDERELGPEPIIASVSLGATRTFQMRHKRRSEQPRFDLDLPHGSLLWMAGPCQRYWKHQIPKRRGKPLGPRINLTFRVVRGRDDSGVGASQLG